MTDELTYGIDPLSKFTGVEIQSLGATFWITSFGVEIDASTNGFHSKKRVIKSLL